MANVGTIWVKIGADATELQKVLTGSKAELGKFADGMQQAGTRLAAAGVALTGPLVMGLKSIITLGDQLDEMAQKTGVSVETLSRFSVAAKKSELDLDSLATGFKFLAVRMTDALKAGTPQAEMFKKLGISVADASGKLRPMEDVMMDIADKFAAMKNGAEKTNLAVELFSRSGMQFIHFLNMGREGLEANAEMAEHLSVTMSGKTAKAFDLVKETVDEFKLAIQGVFIQIGTSLLPAMQTAAEYVRDLVAAFGGLLRAVPILGTAIGGLTLGIGGMAVATGAALVILAQLIKSIQAITAATRIAEIGRAHV
jgi:hypothetical protein